MNNRIKKLRDLRGLSQAALAAKCDTTAATIQRLESGERQLTEKWMRELAKGLDVRPADLISAITLADFSDEVEPALYGPETMQQSLQTLGIKSYTVISDSVELAGYPATSPILVNEAPQSPEGLKTGDIVLATVSEVDDNTESFMIIRQFIAPKILITNREGSNLALNLDDDDLVIEIVGSIVPPNTE